MPQLKHITIYPIKSLDGISVQEVNISQGGCLQNDRNYALVNQHGKLITGKTHAAIHQLRSKMDLATGFLYLSHENDKKGTFFHIDKERTNLEEYVTDYFKENVTVFKNTTGRLVDEPDLSGITLVSTPSLQAVTSWFPEINLNETRQRFRANLEIEAESAFWEDQLFTHQGKAVVFRLGDVQCWGIGPCARCVVPTRNPQSGQSLNGFAKMFAALRKEHLSAISTLTEKGHTYCLSVNVFVPDSEIGKTLRIGAELVIEDIIEIAQLDNLKRLFVA